MVLPPPVSNPLISVIFVAMSSKMLKTVSVSALLLNLPKKFHTKYSSVSVVYFPRSALKRTMAGPTLASPARASIPVSLKATRPILKKKLRKNGGKVKKKRLKT